MSNLLLVILNDTSVLPDLLGVWREIGVPGTTILQSAGGHASRNWLSRVGLGAINKLFETKEVETRTLMAVFEDEDLLAQAIAEAERIVGGFDRPNSGVVLVLPVSQALGVYKASPKPVQEVSPPSLRSDWSILRDTLVESVDSLWSLEPTIVPADTQLEDVVLAMLVHPRVHLASVVAKDGRLIGLLKLAVLADDLFFHILPEEFLGEITDLEKLMDYATKTRTLTAQDAMTPPVWVKRDDTVAEAFKRMHDNKLSGLPIVDDLYRVVGYINLLELLSLFIHINDDADLSEEN
ncbi:MAG: CBS domain-containing protein [Anaerolineales bacterium]|uniref:CBS domain-containing protein n=1 Tax=Candidatus Desulfolinea nitratireducens TaxID=2841698 RepID=A0A8J6TIA1_9CHLR|nr:CBS domain-containing protein [Candidatus Desulfolinea nitratireducens]MBL6960956.1 CBS domain-containing protein [Anaerolineales bacterium]